MSEHIKNQQTATIKYPSHGVVEIPPEMDWVYIMRKDAAYTMQPIAERLSVNGHNLKDIQHVLEEEYDIFFSQLADTFTSAFSGKGSVELHLYDPEILENASREKSKSHEAVSLDPLMNSGVYEVKVSRGYYMGGTQDISQVNRPGSESLVEQAKKIKNAINDESVNVFEDDIFSGGSLLRALDVLHTAGLQIDKIIPGIQVGNPGKITELGIEVDPVVQYTVPEGTDIFDKVDLGDPRDFLVGGSGLVIKMPNGEYGRAPYIPPFVSTTARAGIPPHLEQSFSRNVLLMNYAFFERTEEIIGKEIQLKHMDPNFGNYMHEVFGIEKNTPMKTVISWLLDNQEKLWQNTVEQGELQQSIESLQLPANLVFIDVNGTIIPSDTNGEKLNPEQIEQFKTQVLLLQENGCTVGLCSDSPLPQLTKFAEELGLTDIPVIFENGNGIMNQGKTVHIQGLNNLADSKEKIQVAAHASGLQQTDDCVSIEFGGKPPDTEKNEWAFGANRTTSISVFGPPEFIASLGKTFEGIQGASFDCSPEYNYFALHPGQYKQNKGLLLKLLSSYGHNIVMIGDSMSDYIPKDSGVRCTFVANNNLDNQTKTDVTYISPKQTFEGVIDILNQLQIKSD